MKSALAAGLVATLLIPKSVLAGDDTCSNTAYGSNRVTCKVEVAETNVIPVPVQDEHGHHGHHHHDKDVGGVDIIRTVKVYSWSFIWNYVITDDCPHTTANLAAILPALGHTHHAVNCRVEVRWGPDKAHAGNLSYDFAGYSQVAANDLPSRIEWPLPASYDRPERIASLKEWGVEYKSASSGDLNTLSVSLGSLPKCWNFRSH